MLDYFSYMPGRRATSILIPAKGSLHFFLIVAAFLFMAVNSAQALEVPGYTGYVNDYADMISPEVEAKLARNLQAFDRSDSTQIAVLTINSLEGEAVDEFSMRVVDKWQVGQRGKDNGVLLLIAKKEHKIRIEVGQGLEGVLTDLLAGRIIDQIITPSFKAGAMNDGIEAGVLAIMQSVRGEFKGTGRISRRHRGGAQSVVKYLMFAVILVAFLGNISKPLGMISGALLLPLVVFMGFSSPFSLLLLLFLFPLGAASGFLLPLLFFNSMQGRGGMYMGGGGFGSGGMGGGGFGGFGGGGFGGGGASGGW